MTKFVMMALIALSAVGCASKSDLAALQTQIDGVRAEVSALQSDVEAVKANQEALKGDLADLRSKLDRIFTKKILK